MDDLPSRVGLSLHVGQLLECLWAGSPRMQHVARGLVRSHERIWASDPCKSTGNANPFRNNAVWRACDCALALCDKIEAGVNSGTDTSDYELTELQELLEATRSYAKELSVVVKLV